MRIFKIIGITISSIVVLVSFLITLRYFNQSPRGQAEFWYQMIELFRQGSIEQQWCLEKSIQSDPTFHRAYMEKSVAFNKRGHYHEGFKLLNKAVEISPVIYLGYRGYVKLYMLHDFKGAIDDFLRLDPLTPEVTDAPWGEDIYHVIGLSYQQLGELDSAKIYYDRSIQKKTALLGEEWVDVKTFFYYGLVELALGNYQASIDLFDKAIAYSTIFSEAYYYRGLAYQKLNNPIAACANFQESYAYFSQGYAMSNPYYEVPHQIYLSTIENSIDSVCLKKQ